MGGFSGGTPPPSCGATTRSTLKRSCARSSDSTSPSSYWTMCRISPSGGSRAVRITFARYLTGGLSASPAWPRLAWPGGERGDASARALGGGGMNLGEPRAIRAREQHRTGRLRRHGGGGKGRGVPQRGPLPLVVHGPVDGNARSRGHGGRRGAALALLRGRHRCDRAIRRPCPPRPRLRVHRTRHAPLPPPPLAPLGPYLLPPAAASPGPPFAPSSASEGGAGRAPASARGAAGERADGAAGARADGAVVALSPPFPPPRPPLLRGTLRPGSQGGLHAFGRCRGGRGGGGEVLGMQ